MTRMPSTREVVDFVEGLELPKVLGLGALRSTEQDALPPPHFSRSRDDAVAVGSQIAAFAEGFDPALREPIADAFLIAQLAADRHVQTTGGGTRDWYVEYVRVLGGLGLVDEERSINFKTFSGTAVEVHDALIPVLTTVMAPAVAGATALVAVLEGLASMDRNRPWITLFDRTSQRVHANQFQISHAAVVDGVPMISLAAFVLDASRSTTQVLFFRFDGSEARLSHFSRRMTLNMGDFKAAAPALRAKLGDRVTDFIAGIEI
jgi:hypothetical protein